MISDPTYRHPQQVPALVDPHRQTVTGDFSKSRPTLPDSSHNFTLPASLLSSNLPVSGINTDRVRTSHPAIVSRPSPPSLPSLPTPLLRLPEIYLHPAQRQQWYVSHFPARVDPLSNSAPVRHLRAPPSLTAPSPTSSPQTQTRPHSWSSRMPPRPHGYRSILPPSSPRSSIKSRHRPDGLIPRKPSFP